VPKLQISVAVPKGTLNADSGDLKIGVPILTPFFGSSESLSTVSPKSARTTSENLCEPVPRFARIFCGFKSGKVSAGKNKTADADQIRT